MDDWTHYLELNINLMSSAILLGAIFTFILASRGIMGNTQSHINSAEYMKDLAGYEMYDNRTFSAYDLYGFVVELSNENEYHPTITINNKNNTSVVFKYPIKNVEYTKFKNYFKNIGSFYTGKVERNGKGNIVNIKFSEK